MKFTLYPIYGLCEEFDQGKLPFDIIKNVRIENVSGLLGQNAFDFVSKQLGEGIVQRLKDVRCAIVHRYEPGVEHDDASSDYLVQCVSACLRLIRPMRQEAFIISGTIRDDDGTLDVSGFDVPALIIIEVPEVQRLFKLRNQDAEQLRTYAPKFVRAMHDEFWKFRMAVQFHDLGYFQPLDWKARYLLWCSAIESIYTSNKAEHKGSFVATSRIKWFLGAEKSIYAPGDIPDFVAPPNLTVGTVVGDLYEMRNYLAHGDKIPDAFFTEQLRTGLNGGVRKREVLFEAASFIIRESLLKILRQDLQDHFTGADAAEAYFGGHNLTNTKLRANA